jgi:hypothetical protein
MKKMSVMLQEGGMQYQYRISLYLVPIIANRGSTPGFMLPLTLLQTLFEPLRFKG